MVQIKKEQELEHELKNLSHRIHELDKKIQKQISFKWNVLLSIGKGAGYAIGATIVAALLISFLNWTIQSTGDVPVLQQLLESTQ
jgi:hypothetical protein